MRWMIAMRKLPDSYSRALAALKDEAGAVAPQSAGNADVDRKRRLWDAQKRIAAYPSECRCIQRYLLNAPDPTLTIDSLTEAHIAEWLG